MRKQTLTSLLQGKEKPIEVYVENDMFLKNI